MSTEQVLLEARLAVAQARDSGLITAIGLMIAFAVTALWLLYVLDRWSWMPRKDHSKRVFIEKF